MQLLFMTDHGADSVLMLSCAVARNAALPGSFVRPIKTIGTVFSALDLSDITTTGVVSHRRGCSYHIPQTFFYMPNAMKIFL
jgi:hypothetical protein